MELLLSESIQNYANYMKVTSSFCVFSIIYIYFLMELLILTVLSGTTNVHMQYLPLKTTSLFSLTRAISLYTSWYLSKFG